MDNSPKYVEELKRVGLISLNSPFSKLTLEKWNKLLDPLFKKHENDMRSYVNSSELMSLGILEEIFSPSIRSTLRSLMQDAVIFHCHVYEIEANQTVSHIHDGKNLGWHRDEECMFAFEPNQFHHISLFIYLTEVNRENGPFEFAPYTPTKPIGRGAPTLKVLGEPGTTFFWNRAYRHRACPNLSNRRRRLLKLSFQHNHLPNERINLPEFADVLKRFSESDPFLAYVFGKFHNDKGYKEILPQTQEEHSLEILPLTLNSTLEVGSIGLLKMNYLKPIFNRLKETIRPTANSY